MKLKLLAAAASIAFISTGVAFAQDAPKHEENLKHDQRPAEPKAAQTERRNEPANAEARPMKEAPKAAEGERRQEPDAKPQPKAADAERKDKPKAAEMERKDNFKAGETERKDKPKAAEMERKDGPKNGEARPEADAPRDAQGERANDRDRRVEGERANDRNTRHGDAARVTGNVKISNEHATRVGELLRRGARSERVDFDVRVGVRVPETVVVRPLPVEVVTLVPEYRGYDYFIGEDDQIVFVAPDTHEIVGSIDSEGRAAAMDTSSPRAARPCPVEN